MCESIVTKAQGAAERILEIVHERKGEIDDQPDVIW
jgi:hypothetical protein